MWLPKGVFFVHEKETHGNDEIHSLKKKWKFIAHQNAYTIFGYARKKWEQQYLTTIGQEIIQNLMLLRFF